MNYVARTFDLPPLTGISQSQLDVHLALYKGYVTHVNLLREQLHELTQLPAEKFAYTASELRRRFGFEFCGMRLHEHYFEQFEGGAQAPTHDGALARALAEKYGSSDAFIEHFTVVGLSRGIGWSVLYHDAVGNTPHVAWVSDHELGHLAGLPIILAMDMWEHAYMVDYMPAEKAPHIEAFFKCLNWGVVENRFAQMHS